MDKKECICKCETCKNEIKNIISTKINRACLMCGRLFHDSGIAGMKHCSPACEDESNK